MSNLNLPKTQLDFLREMKKGRRFFLAKYVKARGDEQLATEHDRALNVYINQTRPRTYQAYMWRSGLSPLQRLAWEARGQLIETDKFPQRNWERMNAQSVRD